MNRYVYCGAPIPMPAAGGKEALGDQAGPLQCLGLQTHRTGKDPQALVTSRALKTDLKINSVFIIGKTNKSMSSNPSTLLVRAVIYMWCMINLPPNALNHLALGKVNTSGFFCTPSLPQTSSVNTIQDVTYLLEA